MNFLSFVFKNFNFNLSFKDFNFERDLLLKMFLTSNLLNRSSSTFLDYFLIIKHYLQQKNKSKIPNFMNNYSSDESKK